MDTEKIRKLHGLLEDGMITQDEFDEAKRRILLELQDPHPPARENLLLMWLHLSGLGFSVPLIGCVLPIAIWRTHRQHPEMDRHGRMIADWMINLLGLFFIIIVLGNILDPADPDIPFVSFVFVVIVHVVVVLLGATKAFQGKLFQYPLVWKFFSLKPGEEQPFYKADKVQIAKNGCVALLGLFFVGSLLFGEGSSRGLGIFAWHLFLIYLTYLLAKRWTNWFSRWNRPTSATG